MMHLIRPLVALTAFLATASALRAQDPYFPPLSGDAWESSSPASLGWCEDEIPALLNFLEETNTKAFIVLKDGRIVIEEYFGTFTQDSLWYWASAGKSLTAFLVGLAQEEGYVSIDESTSTYLGDGWTSCTPEQESAITVRHQLTMTTGLDDLNGDFDCTLPECLEYLQDPGTRWAYYNAPYTLLDSVLYYGTGMSLNLYLLTRLSGETGIYGAFLPIDYNNVFFSTPRVMARFGLLAMNQGNWGSEAILTDQQYFYDMTHPSQELNPAYGYLWWLNGQESYLLPGVDLSLPGPLLPDAPMDAYSAMGKNGQIINVSPQTGLVVVRMGDLPGTPLFVPNIYNNDIWEYLNAVICTSDAVPETRGTQVLISPNPASEIVRLSGLDPADEWMILDGTGKMVRSGRGNATVDVQELSIGTYLLRLSGVRSGAYPFVVSR